MAPQFDPYYEWLGIPPADQPPHPYRLLGLTLFESNPKVIENAAEQRMLLLRARQSGQHLGHSQRLLNEVAQAQRLLLTPASKAELDAGLQSRLKSAGSAVPLPPGATPNDLANGLPSVSAPSGLKVRPAPARKRPKPRLTSIISLGIGGLVFLLLIAALLPMFSARPSAKTSASPAKHASKAPGKAPPTPVAASQRPASAAAQPAPASAVAAKVAAKVEAKVEPQVEPSAPAGQSVKQPAKTSSDPDAAPPLAKPLEGIVVDDAQATLTGQWTSSAMIAGYVGTNYLHDDNEGKGEKSITFRFEVDSPGSYEVRLYYTSNSNRATNVPVIVEHAEGEALVSFNQRQATKTGYAVVGVFPFTDSGSVQLHTRGTTGHVSADALQLVPR